MKEKHLFTSESVAEGHPDKICDQISDAILDECLRQDPESRVATEVCTKTGMVLIFGEITTSAKIDIPNIARETIKEIGYTDISKGMLWDNTAILVHIQEQSPDISQGIEKKEQGAGDQGMMFGYACKETDVLMPLPIHLAHKLTLKLSTIRKSKELEYLGPDGKTQVTVEYENDKPKRIDAIVVSNQHQEDIDQSTIRNDLLAKVIEPICGKWIDNETKIHINPTGKFVKGGPYADSGLTGRKIIVDTYGGYAKHGGGAFSGKDPSKVDRSAAYVARYIAKNIVASGLAEKCEIQISYAIGVAEPVSIFVDTFGTSNFKNEEIVEMIRNIFPTKPADIISHLKLKRPIYKKTSVHGHFGREDDEFTWEKLDKVGEIKEIFNL
jgi:S-adenosylmethionine synthetase